MIKRKLFLVIISTFLFLGNKLAWANEIKINDLKEIISILSGASSLPNGIRLVREFIINYVTDLGIKIDQQEFGFNGGVNLMIYSNDYNEKKPTIVLGAHYDSDVGGRILPGADDNASGVSAILLLAKALKNVPMPFNIIFVMFDQSSKNLTGSKKFIEFLNEREIIPAATFIFDTIGYDGNNDGLFEFRTKRNQVAKKLSEKFSQIISEHKSALKMEVKDSSDFISDDLSFYFAFESPAILISEHMRNEYGDGKELDIAVDSNPHLHSPTDTIDHLNFNFCLNIIQVFEKFIKNLSLSDLETTQEPPLSETERDKKISQMIDSSLISGAYIARRLAFDGWTEQKIKDYLQHNTLTFISFEKEEPSEEKIIFESKTAGRVEIKLSRSQITPLSYVNVAVYNKKCGIYIEYYNRRTKKSLRKLGDADNFDIDISFFPLINGYYFEKKEINEYGEIIETETIIPQIDFSSLSKKRTLIPNEDFSFDQKYSIPEDRFVNIGIFDSGVDYNHPALSWRILKNNGEFSSELSSNGTNDDQNGCCRPHGYLTNINGHQQCQNFFEYIDDAIGANCREYDKNRGFGFNYLSRLPYDYLIFEGILPKGHGTHVAGIAARGSAHLNIAPFLSPSERTNYWAVFQYAKHHKIKIVNMSAGDFDASIIDHFDEALKNVSSSILLVVASGNDGKNIDENLYYPATSDLENVFVVTAIDQEGHLGSNPKTGKIFANYGMKNVDVAAPGVEILSTTKYGKYAPFTGTSMAAPFVANVAGKMLLINPDLAPSEIKKIIMATIDKKPWLQDKIASGGIVNPERAYMVTKIMLNEKLNIEDAIAKIKKLREKY